MTARSTRRALLLGLALLALLSALGGVAAAREVSDIATDQANACEGLGGTATVETGERTVGGGLQSAHVSCEGGLLDGMDCVTVTGTDTLPPMVSCGYLRVGTVEGAHVPVGEVVAFEAVAPVTALPAAYEGARPAVAEDPTGGTTVMANQVGDPIGNALAQANACRALGGDVYFQEQWNDFGVGYVVTVCRGGLLDGLFCDNDTRTGTHCHFMRLLEPTAGDAVTPAAGAEQPAEAAPAATEPAAAPTPTVMPTMMPTDAPAPPTEAPAEPTVMPTTLPDPKVDGGPPSGPIDPDPGAPTPTQVVLT